MTSISSSQAFYTALQQQQTISRSKLEAKADKTVQGNDNLADMLDAISQIEMELLTREASEDEIRVSTDELSSTVTLDTGLMGTIKKAITKFEHNLELTTTEMAAVSKFVSTLEGGSQSELALMGATEEEYAATKDSKKIKYETGVTDDGVEYAIMTGLSTNFLETLREEASNKKNPTKEDIVHHLNKLESGDNKNRLDQEKILGYRFILDNWNELTKSGGNKKLTKSNLKQIGKLTEDNGYVTLDNVSISSTLKKNYHRRKVWGTVAGAVVATVATIATGGALGPVAAGAIGGAAGSITGGVIEGKPIENIVKDAALGAALGAAGGAAAKGASAAASKITKKMADAAIKEGASGLTRALTGKAAQAAVEGAVKGAARSVTTATLSDLADDGRINNVGGIATQAWRGAVSGAVAGTVTQPLGDNMLGNSLERGVQQTVQRAANGETDIGGLVAEFAGGTVSGAVEHGLGNLAGTLAPNNDNKLLNASLTGGTIGFASGMAGELTESAFEGEFDGIEILESSLANMRSGATSASIDSRVEAEKQQQLQRERAKQQQPVSRETNYILHSKFPTASNWDIDKYLNNPWINEAEQAPSEPVSPYYQKSAPMFPGLDEKTVDLKWLTDQSNQSNSAPVYTPSMPFGAPNNIPSFNQAWSTPASSQKSSSPSTSINRGASLNLPVGSHWQLPPPQAWQTNQANPYASNATGSTTRHGIEGAYDLANEAKTHFDDWNADPTYEGNPPLDLSEGYNGYVQDRQKSQHQRGFFNRVFGGNRKN